MSQETNLKADIEPRDCANIGHDILLRHQALILEHFLVGS